MNVLRKDENLINFIHFRAFRFNREELSVEAAAVDSKVFVQTHEALVVVL